MKNKNKNKVTVEELLNAQESGEEVVIPLQNGKTYKFIVELVGYDSKIGERTKILVSKMGRMFHIFRCNEGWKLSV